MLVFVFAKKLTRISLDRNHAKKFLVPGPSGNTKLAYLTVVDDFQWSQIPKYAVVGPIVQCPPYQAVTGKIYLLKQHFLPPAIA